MAKETRKLTKEEFKNVDLEKVNSPELKLKKWINVLQI